MQLASRGAKLLTSKVVPTLESVGNQSLLDPLWTSRRSGADILLTRAKQQQSQGESLCCKINKEGCK